MRWYSNRIVRYGLLPQRVRGNKRQLAFAKHCYKERIYGK